MKESQAIACGGKIKITITPFFLEFIGRTRGGNPLEAPFAIVGFLCRAGGGQAKTPKTPKRGASGCSAGFGGARFYGARFASRRISLGQPMEKTSRIPGLRRIPDGQPDEGGGGSGGGAVVNRFFMDTPLRY